MSGNGEPEVKENAWVTLATNDSYALGALVLAKSLSDVGTKYAKSVLITNGVSKPMILLLKDVFNTVEIVSVMDSTDSVHLAMLARPELGITFTKIHCWLQTAYGKCVFLDADTLVLQNCDELFEREELSAAPDVGWPDCFNSGVFVFRPSLNTFQALVSFAMKNESFDGGDQGLLNLFFKDWSLQGPDKRLPFVYNMCSTACYSYIPAFKMFGGSAKIVHFIGPRKPWLFELNSVTGTVNPGDFGHLSEFLQHWWDLFIAAVLPRLTPHMAGLPALLSTVRIGKPRSCAEACLEEHWRRAAWESSTADYMGRDSFDNIWDRIQSTLDKQVIPGGDEGAGDAEDVPEKDAVASGGESAPSAEKARPVENVALKEDAKGVPQVAAPAQVVASHSLPSAPVALEPLVNVHASNASNLGSLAQTVSQAVAPSLSSLELSLPPAESLLDALTLSQVVPAETPLAVAALSENPPSNAEVAPLIQELQPSKPTNLPLHVAEIPAQAVAESLAEIPAQVVVEALAEIPAQVVAEALAEIPAQVVAEALAEIPAQAVAEALAEIPAQAVAEALAEIPAQVVAESLVEIPAQAVAEALAEIPAQAVAEVLAEIPAQAVAEALAEIPAALPAELQRPALLTNVLSGIAANVSEKARASPPSSPPVSAFAEAAATGPLSKAGLASAMSPPVQSVPRTPTVTEATPPTSPPIGYVGSFPTAPSVTPTATGATGVSKEQGQPESTGQSDAEAAPVPPKRRGGPSKGGKSAVLKGKK